MKDDAGAVFRTFLDLELAGDLRRYRVFEKLSTRQAEGGVLFKRFPALRRGSCSVNAIAPSIIGPGAIVIELHLPGIYQRGNSARQPHSRWRVDGNLKCHVFAVARRDVTNRDVFDVSLFKFEIAVVSGSQD